MMPTQLVWLRNDLRLDDNPALSLAQQAGDICVLYIATPMQWSQHNESQAKLGLRADALNDIGQQLANLGINFYQLETDLFDHVPDLLADFCQRHQVKAVWFNQETALDECRRDNKVKLTLEKRNIHCHALNCDLIVSPPVLTQKGEAFKVFTPYFQRWVQILETTQTAPYPIPKAQSTCLNFTSNNPHWAGSYRTDLWAATEENLLQKLQTFCLHKLSHYPDRRDIPAEPATSLLSPYLSLGRIGPRRLLLTIQLSCQQQKRSWQSDFWLKELAWRDFYRQLLRHFPQLNRNKPFKTDTNAVPWQNNAHHFQAWCEGKTGYPIVDAAMRQLQQTGWMHNRLRMISASFLCKLLLIDWRKGEQFFMQNLIDGDFAANNGGWQWNASTGVDSVPYFRVFNPVRQSEKFDPEGRFIRRFIPELAKLNNKDIHWPGEEQRIEANYPQAIIDYKQARQRAIDAFANLPK